MPQIAISVINASTVLQDTDVSPVVDALQIQVSQHFAPAWGVDASLAFVPTGQQPAAGTWWLAVLDNSDQAGALGYHDLTTDGLPIGKVFAGTDLQYGLSWSVTASHELLEMLGDPDVNLTVFVQPTATSGTLYAYEVCDACEDDSLGYQIGDVTVSDFVFPAYFEAFRQPNSTQFDYGNRLTAPVPTLLPGGYIGAFDVNGSTGWHQISAHHQPQRHGSHNRSELRARVGSRRERRRVPRDRWMRSTIGTMDAAGPGHGN